jgi:hypothetical protein
MPKISNCPGDLAYYLCDGTDEISESYLDNDANTNVLIVSYYLSMIDSALDFHPLSKIPLAIRIRGFWILYNMGAFKVLRSIDMFRGVCNECFYSDEKMTKGDFEIIAGLAYQGALKKEAFFYKNEKMTKGDFEITVDPAYQKAFIKERKR